MSLRVPDAAGGELYRPATGDDREGIATLLADAFNNGPEWFDTVDEGPGYDSLRLVQAANGQIAATGLLIEMGQFFSGVSIHSVGLAAVAVATEHRGRGVALRYMEAILRELHRRKVPLSSLYPASFTLYRRVGYDVGGRNIQRDVNPALINVRERRGSIAPVTTRDHETIRTLYRRMAERENGLMDRPAWRWKRLLEDAPGGKRRFRYLAINDAGEPGGYIIYHIVDQPGGYKNMVVEDVCALDEISVRRLLGLLSEARSQISNVTLFGAWRDLLELLTPERVMAPSRGGPWFLRLIDMPEAMQQRPWPRLLSGEVHLAIEDNTLPENSGAWIARLDGGRMQLERGGRGDVVLDIGALATLYGGCWTPQQLVAAGRLKADPEALDFLTLLFSGAPAWMPDRF